MALFGFQEGLSLIRPPFFNGMDYTYWKTRIRVFLLSLYLNLWNFIENVLTVFPDDDILICSDGFEKVIFIDIGTQKIVQVIKIDEITGSYLSIREAFDIKLMLEKILIGIYIDPKSLKEFETVKYYSFKREF